MTVSVPPRGVRYGPEGKPNLTLGIQAIEWAMRNLLQPDGPNAGQPWRFTPEQARFVLHWYAIDDRGRFIYRSGVYRRMKGAGKNPFAAALCCIEFVGPCRFKEFRNGSPVATEHEASWVQTAAVAQDQTRNMMTLFPGMFSRDCIEEHQIDLGKQIIYAHKGKRRIEAVTSSPRALEGGRATFQVKDENHHWIQANEGLEMAAVMARNAAKSRDGSARVLAITNAFAPGEGSDAERDWEAFRLNPSGILYDSLEAPEDIDLGDTESLRQALLYCRGDSIWLDVDRLIEEIQDPRTSESMARRFYLNQLAASEDRAFDREQWASLARSGYAVEPGALVTLGFDGSQTRDHTVLIGTEIATGYQWVVGYWEPNAWGEIPVAEVDQTISAAFERWRVWRLNADPFWWQEQVSAWAGRYNKPGQEVVVSWNTTLYKKMAYALLNYRNAIEAGDLSHDGDPRFAAAIANAHKHVQQFVDDNGERLWTIQKERPDSPFKIDAAMAGCLSWEARTAAIAAGALNTPDEYAGVFWA